MTESRADQHINTDQRDSNTDAGIAPSVDIQSAVARQSLRPFDFSCLTQQPQSLLTSQAPVLMA